MGLGLRQVAPPDDFGADSDAIVDAFLALHFEHLFSVGRDPEGSAWQILDFCGKLVFERDP